MYSGGRHVSADIFVHESCIEHIAWEIATIYHDYKYYMHYALLNAYYELDWTFPMRIRHHFSCCVAS